jgi:hypothetical protein
MGFSLHAATTASDAEEWLKNHADDARGREALVRYALRPPIAQERLHILPENLVRIELKRPFSDGDAEEWLENHTVAIDLDPLSLLCRLAASFHPRLVTSCITREFSVQHRNYARSSCHLHPPMLRAPRHMLTATIRPRIGLSDAEEWSKDHIARTLSS